MLISWLVGSFVHWILLSAPSLSGSSRLPGRRFDFRLSVSAHVHISFILIKLFLYVISHFCEEDRKRTQCKEVLESRLEMDMDVIFVQAKDKSSCTWTNSHAQLGFGATGRYDNNTMHHLLTSWKWIIVVTQSFGTGVKKKTHRDADLLSKE